MKRSDLFVITTAAVVLAGIGVCRETKRRQKRAMAERRHVPYGPFFQGTEEQEKVIEIMKRCFV